MANAAAAAAEHAQLAVEQSKLPVFHSVTQTRKRINSWETNGWNNSKMVLSPETGALNVPSATSTILC